MKALPYLTLTYDVAGNELTPGGTPLQEPNGDVPLDGVAFLQLE